MSDFIKEKEAMHSLTDKYINKLTCIWEHIFHPDTCRENLHKLIDHATDFYEGLLAESLLRKTSIENEINDLKKEACNLNKLLNTNTQLTSFETSKVPLVIAHSEIEKSLEELREQLRHRKEQICELLLEQDVLCEELGEEPRALPADPLPTAEEINDFRQHLDGLQNKRLDRLSKVGTLRREIANFMELLELNVNTEHDDHLLNDRQIKLNTETIDDLQQLHSSYGLQVRQLEESIQCMRKKLDSLWKRLKTSPNTRNKFKRYNDYNQKTYNIFNCEIQRCVTLKNKNAKLFVDQIREEITKMWEKTLKSEAEKSCFLNFTSTCYNDDLLLQHEIELENLNIYYESNKQIFELFTDRNILWQHLNDLEAKSSDPERYNNRGGRLLKEEKDRKSITTKLPKIEKQIFELAQKYEKRENSTFLVYGENIIEYIAAQWDNKRHGKEQTQSARKNVKSIPSSNRTPRTPLSANNVLAANSLRKTPSTISRVSKTVSSQKRKLNPSEQHAPVAKRSLMQALRNSAEFLKPCTSNGVLHTNSTKKSIKKNPKKSAPSPAKHVRKPKIIATTIQRRSGNLKKRRSHNKSSAAKKPPKIGIENDDTYDSFRNCIEPAAHSSVIQNSALNSNSSRTKYLDDENEKLKRLPRPPITNRTPYKRN